MARLKGTRLHVIIPLVVYSRGKSGLHCTSRLQPVSSVTKVESTGATHALPRAEGEHATGARDGVRNLERQRAKERVR